MVRLEYISNYNNNNYVNIISRVYKLIFNII